MDGNDTLDQKEFRTMLKAVLMNEYASDAVLERMAVAEFNKADKDHDGVVSAEEFVYYYWRYIIFMLPPTLNAEGKPQCAALYDIYLNACGASLPTNHPLSENMWLSSWVRLCRMCKLASDKPGSRCSMGDLDIIFKTIIGRHRAKHSVRKTKTEKFIPQVRNVLNYGMFLEALQYVADRRKEGLDTTIWRILNSAKLPKMRPSPIGFIKLSEDDYGMNIPLPPVFQDFDKDHPTTSSSATADGTPFYQPTVHQQATFEAAVKSPERTSRCMRSAAYLEPSQLMQRVYEIFQLYASSSTTDKSLALDKKEWVQMLRDAKLFNRVGIKMAQETYRMVLLSADQDMQFQNFVEALKMIGNILRISLNEVVESISLLFPRVSSAHERIHIQLGARALEASG